MAAENGHLEMLKWLHLNVFTCYSTGWLSDVAKKGHTEVVKYIIESGLVSDRVSIKSAIQPFASRYPEFASYLK